MPRQAGERRKCRAAEAYAARIRAGLIDPRAEAIRRHEVRPTADHLAEWKQALIAKGGTVKHANLHFNRPLASSLWPIRTTSAD